MATKDSRNINIEVPIELWKKIKILSVHKDKTLTEIIVEVLDKVLSKKSYEVNILED